MAYPWTFILRDEKCNHGSRRRWPRLISHVNRNTLLWSCGSELSELSSVDLNHHPNTPVTNLIRNILASKNVINALCLRKNAEGRIPAHTISPSRRLGHLRAAVCSSPGHSSSQSSISSTHHEHGDYMLDSSGSSQYFLNLRQ